MSRVTPFTGLPASVTVPSVGGISPDMMLSNVDLPQPLGPTMVMNSPAATSNEMLSTALMTRSRAKKRLLMPFKTSIGRPAGCAGRCGSPERRNGVDLDHQLGLREAPHLDCGAGRHGMGVVFHSHVGVLEVLVDIGDIGIRADEVVEGGAGSFQRRLDVFQRLPQLRAHVVDADDPAVLVTGKLSGDEDEAPRLDADDMRVEHAVVDATLMQRRGLDVPTVDRQRDLLAG